MKPAVERDWREPLRSGGKIPAIVVFMNWFLMGVW
jgi:hypothetical protein